MKHSSPLRYPGGKAAISDLLTRTIELNNLSACSYYEPFAGGAGAALHLLQKGIVSELHLNDVDPRISAFWQAALNESERFIEKILTIPLNVEEWEKQRNVCHCADTSKPFELGFSAFYLNRCNRSGVLLGAGPIGGYQQAGKWSIDARFNRENLAERILMIARKRDQIHITNIDALIFLAGHLPRGHERKRVFVYLDPPYFSNGSRLYMNFYRDRDHLNLSRYIQRQKALKWVMSYDDAEFIRKLYAGCAMSYLSLQYSLQCKQRARELLIAPTHVILPALDMTLNSRSSLALSK